MDDDAPTAHVALASLDDDEFFLVGCLAIWVPSFLVV